MSRSREFAYSIGPRHEGLGQRWEALWMDCSVHKPIMSCKEMEGGGSSPEEVSMFFYCTRAKARRIKDKLDVYFGTTGRLMDEQEIKEWLDEG